MIVVSYVKIRTLEFFKVSLVNDGHLEQCEETIYD